MTNQEFDVMDELYFVSSYEELESKLGWEQKVLHATLLGLIAKGWVKCLSIDALVEVESNSETDPNEYKYLATKAGLLAHNSIS